MAIFLDLISPGMTREEYLQHREAMRKAREAYQRKNGVLKNEEDFWTNETEETEEAKPQEKQEAKTRRQKRQEKRQQRKESRAAKHHGNEALIWEEDWDSEQDFYTEYSPLDNTANEPSYASFSIDCALLFAVGLFLMMAGRIRKRPAMVSDSRTQ